VGETLVVMRRGARDGLPKSATLPLGTLEAVAVQQTMHAFMFDSGCNQGHARHHLSLHPDRTSGNVAQG
jgi:hypothetical protein